MNNLTRLSQSIYHTIIKEAKSCDLSIGIAYNNFFLNFILIYELNIKMQISLIIGNLYSANLITGIFSIKK